MAAAAASATAVPTAMPAMAPAESAAAPPLPLPPAAAAGGVTAQAPAAHAWPLTAVETAATDMGALSALNVARVVLSMALSPVGELAEFRPADALANCATVAPLGIVTTAV